VPIANSPDGNMFKVPSISKAPPADLIPAFLIPKLQYVSRKF